MEGLPYSSRHLRSQAEPDSYWLHALVGHRVVALYRCIAIFSNLAFTNEYDCLLSYNAGLVSPFYK